MLAIVAFRWRERGDAASKGESERGTHGATPTSGCQRLDQRAAQQVGTLLVAMLPLNPNAAGKNGSGAGIRGFRICGFRVQILFCTREFADSDTRKSSGLGADRKYYPRSSIGLAKQCPNRHPPNNPKYIYKLKIPLPILPSPSIRLLPHSLTRQPPPPSISHQSRQPGIALGSSIGRARTGPHPPAPAPSDRTTRRQASGSAAGRTPHATKATQPQQQRRGWRPHRTPTRWPPVRGRLDPHTSPAPDERPQ
jgi:hypothetical protein